VERTHLGYMNRVGGRIHIEEEVDLMLCALQRPLEFLFVCEERCRPCGEGLTLALDFAVELQKTRETISEGGDALIDVLTGLEQSR